MWNFTWASESDFHFNIELSHISYFRRKILLGIINVIFTLSLNLSRISTYRRKIELGLMKLTFYSKFKFASHFDVRREILFGRVKLNFTRRLNLSSISTWAHDRYHNCLSKLNFDLRKIRSYLTSHICQHIDNTIF